jgi:hypothetical protein
MTNLSAKLNLLSGHHQSTQCVLIQARGELPSLAARLLFFSSPGTSPTPCVHLRHLPLSLMHLADIHVELLPCSNRLPRRDSRALSILSAIAIVEQAIRGGNARHQLPSRCRYLYSVCIGRWSHRRYLVKEGETVPWKTLRLAYTRYGGARSSGDGKDVVSATAPSRCSHGVLADWSRRLLRLFLASIAQTSSSGPDTTAHAQLQQLFIP